MVDLQILPNTIIINGGTVIANGPMGENSFAVLVCNSQKVRTDQGDGKCGE